MLAVKTDDDSDKQKKNKVNSQNCNSMNVEKIFIINQTDKRVEMVGRNCKVSQYATSVEHAT